MIYSYRLLGTISFHLICSNNKQHNVLIIRTHDSDTAYLLSKYFVQIVKDFGEGFARVFNCIECFTECH